MNIKKTDSGLPTVKDWNRLVEQADRSRGIICQSKDGRFEVLSSDELSKRTDYRRCSMAEVAEAASQIYSSTYDAVMPKSTKEAFERMAKEETRLSKEKYGRFAPVARFFQRLKNVARFGRLRSSEGIVTSCIKSINKDAATHAEARDTVKVWKRLADEIGDFDQVEELSRLQNLGYGQLLIDKAAKFSKWVDKHEKELKRIEMLDLNDLDLGSLPQEMGILSNIRVIHLEGHKLESFPDCLGNLAQLERIVTDGGTLRPIGAEDAKNAMSVLRRLAESIGDTDTIKEINGMKTEIDRRVMGETLSDWIEQHKDALDKLEDLDLSGCDLTALPKEMGDLAQLKTLNLAGNQFADLPGSLHARIGFQKLKVDLRNNPITDEGRDFMKKLGYMDRVVVSESVNWERFKGDDAAALSTYAVWKCLAEAVKDEDALRHFEMLESDKDFDDKERILDASHFGAWFRKHKGELQGLKKLDLSGLGLTSIPEEIGELSNVESLNLGGNQLEELPDFIREFKNLKALGVGGNKFRLSRGELSDWENKGVNVVI